VKGEEDSNKRVDCRTDVEEGVVVKRLLVGGLVDCDVGDDEDWDKTVKGLVETTGVFVDEVAGGWNCAKEVEGGLTGVFVVGGREDSSGVSAVADVSDVLDSVMKGLSDVGRGGETVGSSEAGRKGSAAGLAGSDDWECELNGSAGVVLNDTAAALID